MNHNLFLAQDEGCLMGGTRILVAIMCGLFVNCRKTKIMFFALEFANWMTSQSALNNE